jgi:molybdopterin converting factor subunit 1
MELNEVERSGEEEEEAGGAHHQRRRRQGGSPSGRTEKKQITVRALLFAHARELAGGVSEVSLHIDDGWTTAQCLENILTRFPALKSLASCLTLALNDSYVDKNAPPILVRDGDELALIPPISGG